MQSSVVTGLEALSRWRANLDRSLLGLGRFLIEHDLDSETDTARLAGLRERLASEQLTVAFVAEFSRGKSELINAIFFADAGRRILPATPGRTTMCPVELHHNGSRAPSLSLLPIETRLRGLSLSELRNHYEAWQHLPLNPEDPAALAQALNAVTQTQRVDVEMASTLGFWSDEHPEDNPPQGKDGLVEVPAWRHAVINYPHELLKRGLVVIDTPGLNAIGAEPELTLSLLPAAHATVFVLAADTGVTRSDLAVWREHLSAANVERFVVLNKIDTLADPLATKAEVDRQIQHQREDAATTLGLPLARVFPVSARDALAARVAGDAVSLARSRLPELEAALASQLMPRQRELIAQAAGDVVQAVRVAALRRVIDRRRQNAEQMLELRGLRGKSGAKVRMMVERIDAEMADFEHCTKRLSALRAVKTRMLLAVLASLSSDTVRSEVAAMQAALADRPLNLGARQAFTTLCGRLRTIMAGGATQIDEMRQMIEASSRQLNADFGFAFTIIPPPSLNRFDHELELIEAGYGRYLSITQAWRLAAPGFKEQFRRMLLSKLRMVFESAAAEIELWSKSVSGPMDQQLRDKRLAFQRRREALERIQGAAGELEARIVEVEAQDQRAAAVQDQLDGRVEALITEAMRPPEVARLQGAVAA